MKPAPFDSLSWPRAVLLAAASLIITYAWAYSIGTTRPVETRSSTPEAWTPATASEPVEVEAP